MITKTTHYEVEIATPSGFENRGSSGDFNVARKISDYLTSRGDKTQIVKITRTEKTEVIG